MDQCEIDPERKALKLWVRRKRGTKTLICSGCGRHCGEIDDATERTVRDLPWAEYTATVVVELHRVRCPDCGPKIEKVAQLPSKAPYSKRFEDTVGQACESASARQVARRIGVAESTVRAMDLRYLERWEASRRKPPLRQMGVDELYRGKKDKFLTVVCNLETAEPLWFGKERKKETLDEFFRSQWRSPQRKRIEAACVDMWEPFRLSLEEWAPQCKIVYDKFHILPHANDAIDEVRRAEFFRQGKKKREVIKGKKWLLMSRWKNLTGPRPFSSTSPSSPRRSKRFDQSETVFMLAPTAFATSASFLPWDRSKMIRARRASRWVVVEDAVRRRSSERSSGVSSRTVTGRAMAKYATKQLLLQSISSTLH